MIANIQAKDFKGFTGGKNTFTALTLTPLESSLIARDIAYSADGVIRKRPGYTQVASPLPGLATSLFDFQRQSDDTQRIFAGGAGKLVSFTPAAPAVVTALKDVDPDAIFQFVTSLWAAYFSNGLEALRYVNNAGQDVIYNNGIAAPAAAPTIAASGGTLNLQYGRQYCYCYVSILTDSMGTQRISIGPPSALSAQTGPLTDSVVTVGGMPASADPQVTHKWIFATVDTPLNSTSAFYFAAEITNNTLSWGDDLDDSALDTTRQAPWANYPAPAAEILVEYQNRIAAARIAGAMNRVQFSGYEEIDIGTPQEAWPPDLFFEVPAGVQEVSAMVEFANQLMISTPEFWFAVAGYDAQTFTKRDKVAQPGAVGKRAVCTTPSHMCWVSKDKKLWAWDTFNAPIELSLYQRTQLAGTLSMQDLNDTTLESAILKYFNYGGQHKLMLFCNSAGNAGPGFDWIAVWDLDSQGAPLQQSEVAQAGRAAQSDYFPGDYIGAATIVEIDSVNWLYLGDAAGNVHRFPDGWTDAGKTYQPIHGTPWHHLGMQSDFFNQGPSAVMKRLYWIDIATDRDQAARCFKISAVAADGVPMDRAAIDLPLQTMPAQQGQDSTTIRALMTAPGTSMGRWVRWIFVFPRDDQPASIEQYTPNFAPLYQGAP